MNKRQRKKLADMLLWKAAIKKILRRERDGKKSFLQKLREKDPTSNFELPTCPFDWPIQVNEFQSSD